MLTRINDEQAAKLSPLFAGRATESIRIAALLSAYGTTHSFLLTYIQSRNRAILSQIDDTFLMIDFRADYAELASFISWSPHFARLVGEYRSLEHIVSKLPAGSLQRYVRMVAYSADSSPDSSIIIDRSPSLRDIYRVGGISLSPFDAWYADMSHRIRHGCARAYLIRVKEEPVSACLISAGSTWAGLISSVYTKNTFRGHGFASTLVAAARNDLLTDKKLAVLECDFSLCRFYAGLGFIRDCETGTYERTAGDAH